MLPALGLAAVFPVVHRVALAEPVRGVFNGFGHPGQGEQHAQGHEQADGRGQRAPEPTPPPSRH